MLFHHAPELWQRFPDLRVAVLAAEGLHAQADVSLPTGQHIARAQESLAAGPESERAAIQAWRRAYAALGLKPTQYRCASESLLRRLRKEGALPSLHPLVDLCNAISVAYAIPVAVLDRSRIAGDLVVRPALGTELYEAFGGELEHPEPGEVTFADSAERAHARRWTHRQSGHSAVRAQTRDVLIVAEALHPQAAQEVQEVLDAVRTGIEAGWGVPVRAQILTAQAPVFRV